jgi:hypothetical protein
MKTINKNTLLKCENKIFQPIEVEGVIYWYEEKQIPNAGYIKSICLGEIEDNKQHEVKFGDKQYISPFVNNVGECYGCRKIIAQSQPKLKGIPVISLDKYVERLAKETRDSINKVAYCCSGETEEDIFDSGFIISHKTNPNQYTQKDIDKAIKLARRDFDENHFTVDVMHSSEIIEQINSISIIEVDEQFNIISYE